MSLRASTLTRALFAASNTAFTVSKAAMAGSMHITLLFSHRIESGIYAVWWAGWAILKKLRDRNTEMMQKFCKFRNLMHEPEMRLARSPILCSKLTMMTVLEFQQGSKKSLLGPASTAFVCNVSEKGDRIHRCMHCSLRKDLRCMHSFFERRRPGHASFFDRGLVSPVRWRKHVLNNRV